MKLILGCVLLCAATGVFAKPAYTGTDISGTYDCTGDDAHEGKYTGTVKLTLVKEQSTGEYGAYGFSLEVPGYGTYKGQAATHGKQMAVHFALPDQTTRDYGTGIATLARSSAGKWSFSKYYYEPEFKGGNYGTEHCVQR
jgi:hypothetical protein